MTEMTKALTTLERFIEMTKYYTLNPNNRTKESKEELARLEEEVFELVKDGAKLRELRERSWIKVVQQP